MALTQHNNERAPEVQEQKAVESAARAEAEAKAKAKEDAKKG